MEEIWVAQQAMTVVRRDQSSHRIWSFGGPIDHMRITNHSGKMPTKHSMVQQSLL